MANITCTPGEEFPFTPIMTFDFSSFNATYPLTVLPAWEVAVKVTFYVVAMIIDLVGNSIIILIITLNRKMRTTTNVLILNLAVSDLFVGIFCMWIHMGNQIDTNWPFGSFMCKVSTFSQVMSVTASVLTLTVISVERFIAIVFPFKAKWSPLTLVIVIVSTWIAAVATASPHLFVRHLHTTLWYNREDRWCAEVWTKYYKDESCQTWERGRVVYYSMEGIVMYFLPIAIMIVAYSLIAIKLLTRRAPGSLINSTSSAQDKAKKKVTKMLVTVIVVFIICWTPQQTLILISVLDIVKISNEVKYSAVFVAYFNSAINPILYGGFNENFRKGFTEAFKCVLVQKRNKIGIDSTARSMAAPSKFHREQSSFIPRDGVNQSGLGSAHGDRQGEVNVTYSNSLRVPWSTVHDSQDKTAAKTSDHVTQTTTLGYVTPSPPTTTDALQHEVHTSLRDIFIVKSDSASAT